MDQAPDVSTVYQAIDTLYGPDGVSKGNASVWLGELQKSVCFCFVVFGDVWLGFRPQIRHLRSNGKLEV